MRKLLLNVAPGRPRSAIFRQMLNRFARDGERARRLHRGYDEHARQPPRPIRALRRHGFRLSGPASGGANETSPNATGIATERANTKQNEVTRNCSPEANSTDKSASGGTGERTKRHFQNFKTGALNHSATLPSLQSKHLKILRHGRRRVDAHLTAWYSPAALHQAKPLLRDRISLISQRKSRSAVG